MVFGTAFWLALFSLYLKFNYSEGVDVVGLMILHVATVLPTWASQHAVG